MYSIYDKYGRYMLIVICSLLMLTMVVIPSSNGVSAFFGGKGPVSGVTIHGKPFPEESYDRAVLDLNYLQNFGQVATGESGSPRFYSMLQILRFGEMAQGAITDEKIEFLTHNPLIYAILSNEAEAAGTPYNAADLDAFMQPPFGLHAANAGVTQLAKTDPRYERMREAIERLLRIRAHAVDQVAALSPTANQINNYLAMAFQRISVRMIEFNASDFISQVPTPTTDQLQKQFDAYAALPPAPAQQIFASRSESNPHGYGYRIPDRVKLQYLSVSMADIRKAVDASKPTEEWEIEASKYYFKNRTQFAATQPTTRSTTQPATAPAFRPFSEVKAQALEAVKTPLIEEQQKAIMSRIYTMLQKDYQEARAKVPTTQAVADYTSATYGKKVGDEQYLVTIAQEIDKQFHVLPRMVSFNAFKTQEELDKEGLADTILLADRRARQTNLTEYVFGSLRDLQTHIRPGSTVLELFQPTAAFASINDFYIARVVAAEASHPPAKLDDVREEVTRDVINSLANQKAEEFARASLADARNHNLESVAGTRKIITSTEPFGLPNPRMPIANLPGYDSGKDFMLPIDLIRACFDLQRNIKSPAELPYTDVVTLPRHDKVFLVQLTGIETQLDTKTALEVAQDFTRQARRPDQQTAATLITEWLEPSNIVARNGVVMPNPPEKKKGDNSAPVNTNPFMP